MKRELIFICCALAGVDGKYVQGYLQTSENHTWQFLARFCWLSDIGGLQYHIEYPKSYEIQSLGLYYDSPGQWPAVYNTDKNCSAKRSVLSEASYQFIHLHRYGAYSGCADVNRSDHLGNYTTYVKCSGGRSFHSARERWWFIAVMNCDSVKGLKLKYQLWLTNGHKGEFFFEHFSADEFYILIMDMVALFIYGIMIVSAIGIALRLKSRQLYHTTYKMFIGAILLQFFALLFLCIAYGKYAKDGVGSQGCKDFGRFLSAAGVLLFQLLLILLAKGFTITRGRLRQQTTMKIALFFTFYTIIYATLFVYNAEFMDPGEVLYIYESPAGYGLIAMRAIGWCWFIYAILFTLKHHPDKALFYIIFFGLYSLWFMATPTMIIIATYRIEKWVREKVVNGVEITINLVAHATFMILTLPMHNSRIFPYHVRTTQVSTLPAVDSTEKEQEDNFPQHAYAPAHTAARPPHPHHAGPYHVFTTTTQPPASLPSAPPMLSAGEHTVGFIHHTAASAVFTTSTRPSTGHSKKHVAFSQVPPPAYNAPAVLF